MVRTVFLLATLLAATGCLTKQYNWDMSQLRDPRAADLDQRLTAERSTVASPFGSADADDAE